MGMEEFDIEPQPPDREVQFCNAMAILFTAATFVVNLKQSGIVDLITVGISLGAGVAAWGAWRATLIASPVLLDMISGVKRVGVNPGSRPEDKPEPPIVRQDTAVPEPIIMIDVEGERPLEVWEQALEDKLRDNDRFLVLNGRQWSIPDTVSIDHLFQLAEARAEGKLRQFLSPNSLNDYAGISRNGKAPNAQSLIDFLASIGAVKSNGERRPYSLTELGEKLFPEKFETPPPAPANGVLNTSRLLSD